MTLLTRTRPQLVPIFILSSLAIQGVTLLLALGNWRSVANLAQREVPSLVQLSNGEAATVAPLGNRERTPAVVQRFATDVVVLLMNMTNQLPIANPEDSITPQADPGIPVATDEGDRRVTTAAWEASWALSADFRQDFLQQVARLTPEEVFEGETRIVLVPVEVGVPEQLTAGEWRVSLVANLIVFRSSDQSGEAIPFNKEIFVRAVDVPKPPEASSPLTQQVYRIREAGLEIYAIRDLERPTL
jgi:hypothetical protein